MKLTDLKDDEVALLERYRKGNIKSRAAGYEDGVRFFQLVLSILSLEPQPTRGELERLLLQEAERALKAAPPEAKCMSLENAVNFYGKIHAKRTGKKHNE